MEGRGWRGGERGRGGRGIRGGGGGRGGKRGEGWEGEEKEMQVGNNLTGRIILWPPKYLRIRHPTVHS